MNNRNFDAGGVAEDESHVSSAPAIVDEKLVLNRVSSENSPSLKPGEVIPEDFKNPELGVLGHYCVDAEGRYQPTWFSLILQNFGKMLPGRQYFALNGKHKFFVRTGVWLDVPPEVVSVLADCVVQVTKMDYDEKDLVVNDFAPKVVSETPRFPATIYPSK